MTFIVGLAIGLVIAGLVMCLLSKQAQFPLLVLLVFWAGIVMLVVGLVFLLTPVLVWLNLQLHSMFGV